MSVSVCTVLLAASAAVSGASAANDKVTAVSSAKYAYAALIDGRNGDAISRYSSAIESRKLPTTNLVRALLNRALAFQKTGRYDKAITDYTAAIQVDALSPKMRAVALYNRGLAHQKTKSPAMAIEDFTSALFLIPTFSQAFYSRANVLREHRQFLFAIADYEKARAFNHPEPHLALFGEALTYEAMNQTTRAKIFLLKAVAAKPDFAAAKIKLASIGKTMPLPTKVANTARKPIKIALVNPSVAPTNLVTGSLSPSTSDVTIQKTDLPKPVAVPSNLKKTASVLKMPALPVQQKVIAAKQPAKAIVRTPVTAKVVQVEKPLTTAPAADIMTGWTVQLSSQRNSEAAWDVWKNLSVRHNGLLKKQNPVVVKANLGKKGIYYRLRIHKINTRGQAASICSKLKRRGTSCFVTKA